MNLILYALGTISRCSSFGELATGAAAIDRRSMISEHPVVKACGFLLAVAAACTTPNPRSCADGLCTDPRFPFCDIEGAFGGDRNECIAVQCEPEEHAGCRDSLELRCNSTGNNYDLVECEPACIENVGCELPRELFVVFVSDRDGNLEIYRMAPDGGQPTNLTLDPGADSVPIWDPTGEHIAFETTRNGPVELFVMNPDGSGVVNVSQGSANGAAWAPDGSALVFASSRSGTSELYKVNVDGSGLAPLTSLGNVGPGDWSPDGSRITFTSSNVIYVMNADGSSPEPITSGTDFNPKWRPDGTLIAFAHRNSFIDFDIFVIAPDGTGSLNITNSANAFEDRPRWSPNGTHLSFTGGNDPDTEVIVVDPDGANSVNVSNSPSSRDRNPCWSPDGSSIVFESDRTGNFEVMSAPRIGGNATNLTMSGNVDGGCSLRPR